MGDLLPTPTAGDGGSTSRGGARKDELLLGGVVQMLPTPSASDGIGGGPNDPTNRAAQGHQVQLIDLGMRADTWNQYGAGITRWEQLTRPAPAPTEPSARAKYGARLNPRFSEWMMGWPDGWVTNLDIKRNDQLRLIGNGVVPQQAVRAIRELVGVSLLTTVGSQA
jgi:DNA (cytosine-5)-methyltransferase 1